MPIPTLAPTLFLAPFLALPGPNELWLILVVLLLFVGGRKLPELARAMGSSITQFKKGMKDDPPSLTEGEEASKDT